MTLIRKWNMDGGETQNDYMLFFGDIITHTDTIPVCICKWMTVDMIRWLRSSSHFEICF